MSLDLNSDRAHRLRVAVLGDGLFASAAGELVRMGECGPVECEAWHDVTDAESVESVQTRVDACGCRPRWAAAWEQVSK